MKEGIRDNMNRLSVGGVVRSLDGIVAWSQVRAGVTQRERLVGHGLRDFPILKASGQMFNAYTDKGSFRNKGFTKNTARYAWGTTDGLAELKARRHHKGGVFLTTFPHLRPGGTGDEPLRTRIDFPQRPFLFWTPKMEGEVRRSLKEMTDAWLKLVFAK